MWRYTTKELYLLNCVYSQLSCAGFSNNQAINRLFSATAFHKELLLRSFTINGCARQIRDLHLCSSCAAGHNKWSKVRHIKGPKDQERSRMTAKLMMQIRLAIRDSGANPSSNMALSQAITMAKAKGVAKATIENTLNNASKSKDITALYEAKGPDGCLLLIDVCTDQVPRTKAELAKIILRHGGSMGGSGSALYAYSKKGVLRVPATTPERTLSEEDAMDLAIEAGAENVETEEDEEHNTFFMFVCDPNCLRVVHTKMTSLSVEPESASIEYIPESPSSVHSDTLEKVSRLIEVLEEHPHVIKIYHNITTEGSS